MRSREGALRAAHRRVRLRALSRRQRSSALVEGLVGKRGEGGRERARERQQHPVRHHGELKSTGLMAFMLLKAAYFLQAGAELTQDQKHVSPCRKPEILQPYTAYTVPDRLFRT